MIKKIFLFSIVTLMLTTGCDSSFDGINTTRESVDASKRLETRATDSNQLNYYWYQGKKVLLKQKQQNNMFYSMQKKNLLCLR